MVKMSGFSKEDMLGKHASILTIDDKEMRKKILEDQAELFEKGFATYEAVYKSNGGRYIDVECTSSMIKNEKGDYIAGVSIIRDISDRKRVEKEIKKTKEFLENVIESSRDGIVITDENGNILSVNSAMENMCRFNKNELIGEHISIFAAEDKSTIEKLIEKMEELFKKGFTTYETMHKTKEDSYINVECNSSMIKDEKGNYIAGVNIIRNITERKKMEQQLLQSEKLKSLGELAGGVSHDFNNVLAAILGRIQLLRMNTETPLGKQERRKSMHDLKKGLEVIEKAAKDGAETVRRIQEFSRRRTADKDFEQVDINELIDNALEFTKMRWKDDAESKGIEIVIQKDFFSLPPTTGSGAELREVFTNLINNALDAMPQGGNISIKSFKENNSICVKIKDTGTGIPKTLHDKIFDPFFTTKGVQSTGLGLSVSYGIINRHRGTITVDSIEGEGTTFTIKLPISERTIKEEKVEFKQEDQRKARILVIEDEEEVRNVLKDILTGAGHEVEITGDGLQGIEIFEKKDFDLVFTDLGMPVVSGWQVAEKIKSINKRVPVALITGWNVELKESEMKKSGVDLIVYKPFEVNQVLRLVQEGMILRDRFKAA
jgi:PAS domain S-box-containing protein